MSVWLDSSSNSNKFKQSYFRDFVDVSGDILVRNGLSLKLYNNNVPTRVQFSVNSKEFHIYNDTNQTYYDISNTKLIHLQDLSENVQSKLNQFTDRTKHIATDGSNSETMIEFNESLNLVKIYNGLDVSSNIVGLTDLSINRNASIGGNTTFTGNIAVSGDVSFNSKLFVSNTITISGDIIPQTANQSNLGSVDKPFNSLFVSNNTINLIGTDSITGNKTVTGISVENGKMKITNPSGTEQQVNVTLNNKTGLGKDSSQANATLDISGTAIISGDVTLNRKLYVGGDASFSGRVDVCGNFYAQYPAASIPASAIVGGVGGGSSIDLSVDLSVNGLTIGCGNSDISTNSVVGYQALLSNTTGRNNSAFGFQTLLSNTTGDQNNAFGLEAIRTNTTGYHNNAFGTRSLYRNTTGISNTAIGHNALYDNSGGSQNSAVGKNALYYNTTGIENSAIGDNAGQFNKTGTYNTFLGANTDVDSSANTWSSSTAIGANALITASNQIMLGTTTETVRVPGKLSISSDSSFSGRVDVCGNFYAKYPASSIPSSAIIGGVPTNSVDIPSNQTISGVKTFTNGLNVGSISVSSVAGNPTFQRVQVGQDIEEGGDAAAYFGQSVSMNSDGTIVAIGANNANGTAGRVCVYKKVGSTWTRLGQIIVGKNSGDQSGFSVSLSSDGTIVAIGAPNNTGVNGANSGHVRVYKYNGSTTWAKIGQDIDGEATNDYSGSSVSLSNDGTIVAIGAWGNAGVTGAQTGHVRVYQYNGSTTWTKLGEDIDGEASPDNSGTSVSLSSDGTIVAIGAPYNDGTAENAGHVRVYQYNGSTTWTKLGQDIDGQIRNDYFGKAVSLSSDGTILAVGAPEYDGTGAQYDCGRVRVYKYNGSAWTQLGQNIDGEVRNDRSGFSVSLSSDGTILAIGAYQNDGTTVTAGQYSDDNRGHVRIYQYSGTTWTQLGSDIDGQAAGDNYGTSVSLSKDGAFVAIGAPYNNNVVGADSGRVQVYQIRDLTVTKLIVNNAVDICGNLYAQYAAASIPASAISGISTSIQTALNLKASIASPDLTGTPLAPTANAGTNSRQIATTEFVKIAVDNLVASAPGALDTLKELASALNNDASFSTNVTNTLATKASAANPIFTGIVTVNASKVTISSDASFSGRVDICGNLYAQYAAASIPASAINGISTSMQSAIAVKADIASPTFTGTVTASKVSISSDASFSGRVDICGNFYAQYPPNSIPASAIIGGVGGGGGGGGEVSQLSSFGTNITFDNNFALIKEAVVDPMSMLLRQFQF